jgi:hypothetical protein
MRVVQWNNNGWGRGEPVARDKKRCLHRRIRKEKLDREGKQEIEMNKTQIREPKGVSGLDR